MSNSKKKLRARIQDVVKTPNTAGTKNTEERAKLIRRRWRYFLLLLGCVLLAILFSTLHDHTNPEPVTVYPESFPEYGSDTQDEENGWVQFQAVNVEKIGQVSETGTKTINEKEYHSVTDHLLYLLTDRDGRTAVYDDSYVYAEEFNTYGNPQMRSYGDRSPGVFYGKLTTVRSVFTGEKSERVVRSYLDYDLIKELDEPFVTVMKTTGTREFWHNALRVIAILFWVGALVFLILLRFQFGSLDVD